MKVSNQEEGKKECAGTLNQKRDKMKEMIP
jgi:hypothetical protein